MALWGFQFSSVEHSSTQSKQAEIHIGGISSLGPAMLN